MIYLYISNKIKKQILIVTLVGEGRESAGTRGGSLSALNLTFGCSFNGEPAMHGTPGHNSSGFFPNFGN